MATNVQSLFEYLNVTESLVTLNFERLEKIRSTYQQLKIAQHEDATTNLDKLVKEVSQKFFIIDDKENLDRLKLCITEEHIEIASQILFNEYLKKLTQERMNARKAKLPSNVTGMPVAEATVEIMPNVICQVLIKQNHPAVIDFITNFLLSSMDTIDCEQKLTERTIILSPDKLYHGRVVSGSPLDEFIRYQLLARGGTIDAGRQLTKFPLVEPLVLVDEFDTWHFDYLRNLFELNLLPSDKSFPRIWKLDKNTQIFYLFELTNGNTSESDPGTRNVDRPSTVSLQRFVEDVCEKENNGMAKKWLDALREDDIFTYDHLANLKFNEWNELRKLSMNGKKTLKSYVDREKQMTNDTKTPSKTEKSDTNNTVQSESKLLADIHQVRLYFYYTLADKFHDAGLLTPAKLDAECVRLSFDEMRKEGFEDDGLFDQMKLFFLPLTMVEKNLAIDQAQMATLSRGHYVQQQELEEKKIDLISRLAEKEDEYYLCDDSIRRLEKETLYQRQRSIDNDQQGYAKFSAGELITIHKQRMECLKDERKKLRDQIQTVDDHLNSLERILQDYNVDRVTKHDKDLIKPNRGFIMYGPPGTGKSDIMSKLSARMGICMVAPPLAAGELNRPLVGESERIIVDICMRCHRIPYLMCCISIDEIDSLAPKRKDDTGDGNLAKLSVLLSVIDGIKDVPNLMIFCATNRLHMMDEAFLRRMSGKFFVGRPSSHARKNILSGIKSWHMSPNLLDRLTMATTNFSGAALRALRRLITVHCVDHIRNNPHYQLDYRTMLKLTEITARQYRIFFGAETLPMIIARSIRDSGNSGDNQKFNDLTSQKNSVYTGKILVNLASGVLDVEAIETNPITKKRAKIVFRHTLLDSETNLQGLLLRLTTYGKLRNVQLLQLVDLNLLSAESAHDEKQKFETLKERLDECAAYRRSMIVYDLDALVGINRSEGSASTGQTTNFSLINHNIYTYVKDKFENTHVECLTDTDDDNETNTEEKWSVVIISQRFLLRQFLDDVKFTRPQSELDEIEAEERRANEQYRCVQCNNNYVESDNRMEACLYHDGFIYDNFSPGMIMGSRTNAIEMLLKEDTHYNMQLNTRSLTPEQKELFERQKNRFRYICCDQILQIGGIMNGCKKGKHSQPHITHKEWEKTCNQNQEYLDKRMKLLQNRIR